MEVDIPPHIRSAIEAGLADPTPTIFNRAQQHAFMNMKYDQFPRYLRSPEYRKSVDRHANEAETVKSSLQRYLPNNSALIWLVMA